MEPAQLALPIPFMTVLIAAAVVIRIATSPAGNARSRICFGLLFAVLGCQAALVGLRFGYNLDAVAPLQRVLPFAVGPLTYLGFRALADGSGLRDYLRHGLPALALAIVCASPLILVVVMQSPAVLANLAHLSVDVLIASSFAFYIWLLIALYRRGPDAFEAVDFASVAQTRRWLVAAIAFLAVNAVVDVIIALDFSLFAGRQVSALIGMASLLAIAASLLMLVLYPRQAATTGRAHRASEGISDEVTQADVELLDAFRSLMAEHQLYRDPDLTLTRLGRRLSVPARRISEGVNRQFGMNVSQFINAHRIERAAELLADSDRPVAEIMAESGFRTKSNFNREFRRVTGMTPVEFRRTPDVTVPHAFPD
jgi:AraC-like DNA-binding protein